MLGSLCINATNPSVALRRYRLTPTFNPDTADADSMIDTLLLSRKGCTLRVLIVTDYLVCVFNADYRAKRLAFKNRTQFKHYHFQKKEEKDEEEDSHVLNIIVDISQLFVAISQSRTCYYTI